MKCPKCGYYRQPSDDAVVPVTDCPACGIVYAKYGPADPMSIEEPSSDAVDPAKPSPVHESSLKQARDRVELRLRTQARARLEEERKAQTLERARRITLETMRRRQLNRQAQSASRPSDVDATGGGLSDDGSLNAFSAGDGGLNRGPLPLMDVSEQPVTGETPQSPSGASATRTANDEHLPLAGLSGVPDLQAVEPDSDEADEVRTVAPDEVQMADVDEDLVQERMPLSSPIGGPGSVGRPFRRWLPAVAFLILFAGVIGAVLSWTTIGGGVNGPAGAVPVGLLLGLAYLTTGVLGFAFFWTSAVISAQLTEIRLLLCSSARSSTPMETFADVAQ